VIRRYPAREIEASRVAIESPRAGWSGRKNGGVQLRGAVAPYRRRRRLANVSPPTGSGSSRRPFTISRLARVLAKRERTRDLGLEQ